MISYQSVSIRKVFLHDSNLAAGETFDVTYRITLPSYKVQLIRKPQSRFDISISTDLKINSYNTISKLTSH